MNHELIVLDTADDVALHTARTIADLVTSRLKSRGRTASVAFSGGNTPTAMLKLLGGLAGGLPSGGRTDSGTSGDGESGDDRTDHVISKALAVDWSAVEVFQVDERIAPPGDEARNLNALQAALLDRRVPAGNAHPIPVELGAAAADIYEQTLTRVVGTPPSIDVIHLGLGPDGHCASLVPGDPVLDVEDRYVATTGIYQGHQRVTLTYPALSLAGALVWQVVGADKSAALARLLQRDASIPAGRVRASRSIVVADMAAAGKV